MVKRSFAVLGNPITHSLSPKIHQAAYKHLGLKFSYQAIQVGAGDLAEFIRANPTSYDGFSITMPLKFEAAEVASQPAELFGTGVANTLVRTEKGWSGYNSDIAGISFALSKCFDAGPVSAAILGAGATARSALVAISKHGIADVTAYARDTRRASGLSNLASELGLTLKLRGLNEYGPDQDLTIDTLPNGVTETLSNNGEHAGWLLSANYAATDKNFTDLFRPEKVVSGVEMLLGQALEQIKVFAHTDMDFDEVDSSRLLEAMRAALQ